MMSLIFEVPIHARRVAQHRDDVARQAQTTVDAADHYGPGERGAEPADVKYIMGKENDMHARRLAA